MELRDLRAFVATAHELHFARAAERLYVSPSTISELIHRLESELGTPLFTRTTRRIALTDAGSELLARAETILDLTAQATEAVGAIARGDVRLGITPPAAPVIAPHLARHFTASKPDLSVDVRRMWLPALGAALQARTIDAALTCGDLAITDPNVTTAEIGSERLLVGLRPDHPQAAEAGVELHLLGERTLGMHPAHLFPAWHDAQQHVLRVAGLTPPIVEIEDTDLNARRWTLQPEIEWIMLIGSLVTGDEATTVRPTYGHRVPFTLSWHDQQTMRPVVRRFVESCLAAPLPNGWLPPLAGRAAHLRAGDGR